MISCSSADLIAMPRKERKTRVYLRVDEYMRLLSAALGNTRDYAILQLFLQTGIRVGELVKLKLSDRVSGQNFAYTFRPGRTDVLYLEK